MAVKNIGGEDECVYLGSDNERTPTAGEMMVVLTLLQ